MKPLKRHSSTTEMLFRTDGVTDQPLLVVYHIQKTAGTAFRQFVRTNLASAEVEVTPDLSDLRYEPERLIGWYGDWYRKLDAGRRDRLCCVMSHSAGYLLPSLEDRSVDAVVLVREPVDRVLSFYWEKRRNFLRGKEGEPDFNLLERAYDPHPEKGPPQAWPQFHNWQSRCLLSVFHDISGLPLSRGPSPGADVWRERLRGLVDRVFTVGVQDEFEAFVDSVARRYGWNALAPRSGVNRVRPALSESPPEIREMIFEYNWLDAELYELCRAAQAARASA